MSSNLTRIFFVLALVLQASPLSTFASTQSLYFHLHQTYEFLEAYKKGHCPTAVKQMKQHLVSADAEFGKAILNGAKNDGEDVFESQLHRLWQLFNDRDKVNMGQVEQVRSEIQSTADVLKLSHKKEWHDELKVCQLLKR